MLHLIVLLLIFSNHTFANATKGTQILTIKEGVLTQGIANTKQLNDTSKDKISVSFRHYISPLNLSASSKVIPRQDLIVEVPEIKATYQERQHTLKKDVIVLMEDKTSSSKEKKPYLVEAVFPGDKVVLQPLYINPNHRNRLKPHNILAKIENENLKIVSASEISAVEQTCFLNYCSGRKQMLKDLYGIPVCESAELRKANTPTHEVPCGRMSSNGAEINMAFSDGTLILRNKLINPFPESTWKYAPGTEAAPASN